ncbi:plancitoxin-1-like [Glandiceps talaboti]
MFGRVAFVLMFISCNQIFVDGAVTCLDENGNSVDWFIVYKLPVIPDHDNPDFKDGVANYYMDSNHHPYPWQLTQTIDKLNHPVGQTIQQIYDNYASTGVAYLQYSDQPPNTQASYSSRAHAKGSLCVDETSGFWMIHSIPRFPMKSSPGGQYSFANNGKTNGQTLICVTYGRSSLKLPKNTRDQIKHLKYIGPKSYDFNDLASLSDKELMKGLRDVNEGVRIRNVWTNVQDLTSLGGQTFRSFAKTKDWHQDIYLELIAQELGSDLFSQTWLTSRSTPLPSQYDSSKTYKVENVDCLRFNDVTYSTTKDHSKWAVTNNDDHLWTCIGDLNRVESQKKRGGGHICVALDDVWENFDDVIGHYEPVTSKRSVNNMCDTNINAASDGTTLKLSKMLAFPFPCFSLLVILESFYALK